MHNWYQGLSVNHKNPVCTGLRCGMRRTNPRSTQITHGIVLWTVVHTSTFAYTRFCKGCWYRLGCSAVENKAVWTQCCEQRAQRGQGPGELLLAAEIWEEPEARGVTWCKPETNQVSTDTCCHWCQLHPQQSPGQQKLLSGFTAFFVPTATVTVFTQLSRQISPELNVSCPLHSRFLQLHASSFQKHREHTREQMCLRNLL